jgi:hypothetical protein
MQLLTKSKFKLGLECPTKLFYAINKKEYEDQSVNDQFLQALAEGGYQVGELAKYLFCNDPITSDITIQELDYETSLLKTTQKRSSQDNIVIAEAAFRYKDLFVRTDLLTEDEKQINIYEVKAKSWDDDTEFLKTISRGPNKGMTKLNPDWSSYMYDIAFQKYVVQHSNTKKEVRSHIVLVDKTKATSIEGLNQIFKIRRDDRGTIIDVMSGTTSEVLGTIPLKIINVDNVCEWIYKNPVEIDLDGQWFFSDLVNYFSESIQKNERIWNNALTTKCKDCQFKNENYPKGKRSGFHECWKKLANFNEMDFRKHLSLDLWGGHAGSKSIVGEALDGKKYFISQISTADFASSKWVVPTTATLDPTQRRAIQILKSSLDDYTPYLDKPGLTNLFNSLAFPYHFIDFETTSVAIPFHKGRHPYEGVAFQYSYHIMDTNGKIEHKNQYLSYEKGGFPNYEFLRSLKADLSNKVGTIFRYHNHENTYLNHIYKQLLDESLSSVPDREELLSFIREIASPSKDIANPWTPKNEMKDLYRYVLDHYYSLFAKGSNSIKDILPSIIKSSSYLQEKYSKPIYDSNRFKSLNFTEPHIWIDATKNMNPYETLPQMFTDLQRVKFELSDNELVELNNGGAAMIAYAYLQFTDLTDEQRSLYRNGLLRYCELDTFAMAMIWEYWGREIGRW